MPRVNQAGGTCFWCRTYVAPKAGYAIQAYGSGWKLIHKHCREKMIAKEKERLKLAMMFIKTRNDL